MVQGQSITWINFSGDQVSGTVAKFIDKNFGYQYSFRWPALVISLLYVLLLRAIVTLTTKYINFQKR